MIQKHTLPILLATVLSWTFLGCSTIQTGNEALVVRAEQTLQIAFDTVDLILKQEYTYRNMLPFDSKTIADSLRKNYPLANETLKNAIRAYKKNRTIENKANLTTALAVVESLLSDAQRWQVAYGVKTSSADPFSLALILLGMIQSLIDWYKKLRLTMAQNAELTPEQEEALDKMQAEMMKSPHWRVEE